jgi:hypothetical protein
MKRRCVVACNDQLVATHAFVLIHGMFAGFLLALIACEAGWIR